MTVRRWLRVIHRDLGYLCIGLTFVYAISGIAINHKTDWNPNYSIDRKELLLTKPLDRKTATKKNIIALLENHGEKNVYKKHYFINDDTIKVFIKGGSAIIDLAKGQGTLERLYKRSFFHEINFLHYNVPMEWWTWFSDLYALGLITLALTGLFVIRGKKGVTGRGAILSILGILFPILFLYIYYWRN